MQFWTSGDAKSALRTATLHQVLRLTDLCPFGTVCFDQHAEV